MASNVAIYARVSSEQQAELGTIRSQIASILERVKVDGYTVPSKELQFIDDGYSGANLIRPALERLRDAAYNGAIDRLYILAPDRLARKYAYQIVLMDELSKAGVEVIFLNREIGKTPEDDLLLQVQGMMAEYERAKILERSRRGKLQGAKRGAVNVLSGAPYGYTYIGKHESGGDARYEIVFEEARVVQQVFDWVGKDRLSLGEVRRRLEEAGAKTRSGKSWWDRTTVWGMLKNPAYMGQAAFGKTKIGEKRKRVRAQRNASSKPRQSYSTYDVPQEEWITVPVPALVSAELFAAVQEQLTENRSLARERRRGATHLLQGLICCKYCDYAFYGKPAKNRHNQHYVYYRCIGTDAYRFGGTRVCTNRQVRADLLEDVVWAQVMDLLENPSRLKTEYERRLEPKSRDNPAQLEAERKSVQNKIARMIDSYADGLINKAEFEPRVKRAKNQLKAIDEQVRKCAEHEQNSQQLQLLIVRVDEFAAKLKGKLADIDWDTKREIVRSVVRRIEIDHDEVNVVFRVTSFPFESAPNGAKVRNVVGRVMTPILSNDGIDLASALATIAECGDNDALNAAIEEAFPGSSLCFIPTSYGLKVGMVMPEFDRPFDVSEFSDGTLQYLCLIAALLSLRAAPLIALNEPEASLHPRLIEPLANLIVAVSRHSQIWITTHNQELADLIMDKTGYAPFELKKEDGETKLVGVVLGELRESDDDD